MGGSEALFSKRANGNMTLWRLLYSRGRRRNVINSHSISRMKTCSFEGFMRGTLRVSSGAVRCVSPRVLWFVPWLKVAPRPSAFTSHALKLSPAHRCGLFDLSWLNLLGDSGSLTDGSLSLSSALLHPLKWHYRNICFFSRIFVPARRQPEMRAEPEWLKERASGRLVYIPNLNAYCFCHAGALIGFKTQSAINTERQPTSLCKTHSLVNCFYLRKKRVFLD